MLAGNGGKGLHAWLDPEGEERLFAGAGKGMAVGSHYTARVTRHYGNNTLHGTPAYVGIRAGEDTRRALTAADMIARTRLEMIRAERRDARDSALDDALAAYVIRKLHTAWHGR